MKVHHINPHVINNHNNKSNNDNFNDLNHIFNSNFSVNGKQVNASQFRGVLKFVVRILISILHLSRILDNSSYPKQQHRSIFKKLTNYFRK